MIYSKKLPTTHYPLPTLKPAFTLIEVLFSVVLISIIGLALLQSSENNTKLLRYKLKREKFIELSSIFALHMRDELHNKSKTLYDLLQKDYKLDDETRKMLKRKKYLLRADEVDTIHLQNSADAKRSIDLDIKRYSISGKFGYNLYSLKEQ